MFRFETKDLNIKTTAIWEKKKHGHFLTSISSEEILFGCPREFGGETDRPSPEDFFLAAIATCTLTSLLRICESLRTTPKKLDVTTSTTLKFNKKTNDYEFSPIKCYIDVIGDEFLLERACQLVPKYCIIGKNIIPKIVYETTITPEN